MELFEITIVTEKYPSQTERFVANSQQAALNKARLWAAWNIPGYQENAARFHVRQLGQDALMLSLGEAVAPRLPGVA